MQYEGSRWAAVQLGDVGGGTLCTLYDAGPTAQWWAPPLRALHQTAASPQEIRKAFACPCA